MKNMDCINLRSKKLIINQDKNGKRKDECYQDNGNCRECRYFKNCDWFLDVNGFLD